MTHSDYSPNYSQQFVVVFLMMSIAFYLQELPSSNVLQMILPEWPFILTLYFAVSTRYIFGVISAFIIGLIQDVFLGIQTLGLHAGIYVLAAFVLMAGRMHFKHMSLANQSLVIGALVLMKLVLFTLYNSVFYSVSSHFWSVLSIPFSILLWPGVHLFFQFFAAKHTPS